MNAIFSDIQGREPQTAPVKFWAVDERDPDEPSHLGFTVSATAAYFNSSAYYFSVRAHKASVDCGGFSVSVWKNLDGSEELQLAYCVRSLGFIRVCGAFEMAANTSNF